MSDHSGERINYALRPAKHIERKMLTEMLRKLGPFGRVESYRYVGFGSFYFVDFALFHKSLGIDQMVSIERAVNDQARFRFNRPFECIDLRFGEARDLLPQLRWDIRTILWLDYDGPLNPDCLADIGQFVSSALTGSFLIITVNAEPIALELFKQMIGDDRVRAGLQNKDLEGWKTSEECRRVIFNQIEETLFARNGGLPAGSRFKYQQAVFFQYRDGARMVTTGGLLYDEGQTQTLDATSIRSLEYFRGGHDPYRIHVPMLTVKERKYIESKIPAGDMTAVDSRGIPSLERERYRSVYRHFPVFAETDI